MDQLASWHNAQPLFRIISLPHGTTHTSEDYIAFPVQEHFLPLINGMILERASWGLVMPKRLFFLILWASLFKLARSSRSGPRGGGPAADRRLRLAYRV